VLTPIPIQGMSSAVSLVGGLDLTGCPVVHAAIQFYAGDTWQLEIACTSNGAPLDLTNCRVITWRLCDGAGDDVVIATLGDGIAIVGDPSAGVCMVTIAASVTTGIAPNFYHDELAITLPNGAVSRQLAGRVQAVAPLP
jgi:hypothetical protein